MNTQLVITPGRRGWRLIDADERLPPSLYRAIEEAAEDAREYLRHHGGGRLLVREGGTVISDTTVQAASGRPGRQ